MRQIYNSVILAAWYKKALKESLLGKIYADKGKVAGVETDDKAMKQRIYEQYLAAFKKGAYNLIKEEADENGDLIPRKYFSGGIEIAEFDDGVSSALTARQVPLGQVSGEIETVSSSAAVTVQLATQQPELERLSAAAQELVPNNTLSSSSVTIKLETAKIPGKNREAQVLNIKINQKSKINDAVALLKKRIFDRQNQTGVVVSLVDNLVDQYPVSLAYYQESIETILASMIINTINDNLKKEKELALFIDFEVIGQQVKVMVANNIQSLENQDYQGAVENSSLKSISNLLSLPGIKYAVFQTPVTAKAMITTAVLTLPKLKKTNPINTARFSPQVIDEFFADYLSRRALDSYPQLATRFTREVKEWLLEFEGFLRPVFMVVLDKDQGEVDAQRIFDANIYQQLGGNASLINHTALLVESAEVAGKFLSEGREIIVGIGDELGDRPIAINGRQGFLPHESGWIGIKGSGYYSTKGMVSINPSNSFYPYKGLLQDYESVQAGFIQKFKLTISDLQNRLIDTFASVKINRVYFKSGRLTAISDLQSMFTQLPDFYLNFNFSMGGPFRMRTLSNVLSVDRGLRRFRLKVTPVLIERGLRSDVDGPLLFDELLKTDMQRIADVVASMFNENWFPVTMNTQDISIAYAQLHDPEEIKVNLEDDSIRLGLIVQALNDLTTIMGLAQDYPEQIQGILGSVEQEWAKFFTRLFSKLNDQELSKWAENNDIDFLRSIIESGLFHPGVDTLLTKLEPLIREQLKEQMLINEISGYMHEERSASTPAASSASTEESSSEMIPSENQMDAVEKLQVLIQKIENEWTSLSTDDANERIEEAMQVHRGLGSPFRIKLDGISYGYGDQLLRWRKVIDKELLLRELSLKNQRPYIPSGGRADGGSWLAPSLEQDDNTDQYTHVTSFEALYEIVFGNNDVSGGFLRPNGADPIFFNPGGQGQAARVRLTYGAGVVPLSFSNDVLQKAGFVISMASLEPTINKPVPLSLLTLRSKAYAWQALLTELVVRNQNIDDDKESKIAAALGFESYTQLTNELLSSVTQLVERFPPVLSGESKSSAPREVGGIDFDPTNMNLQIKRDGKGVPLPLPQQNLEQINIQGLFPVIINIMPINAETLPIFLGQAPKEPAREPELTASFAG